MIQEICKEPQSYVVHSEGKLYRRNRRHILPVAEPVPSHTSTSDTDHQDTGLEFTDCNTQESLNSEHMRADVPTAKLLSDTPESVYRTRSGRAIKPNPKYRD